MGYELSDLSQSVFATLGVSLLEDRLNLGSSPHRRECVLLVDGMGRNAIRDFSRNYSNIASLRDRMTLRATFPSTTATSLTSFGTGKRAGEHGMVGYTMRVPYSGTPERILNALKWDERVDPLIWQPHQTLFERAMSEGLSVSHVAAKRYDATGFTRAALRGARYRGANGIDELVQETISALAREESFVYLYVNDVDEASHSDGYGSEKFLAAMSRVDNLIGRLVEELPQGTRLWVTSDHGMINREDFEVVDAHLLTDVSLMAGEPRVRYLYAQSTDIRKIQSRWEERFGNRVEIWTREEAISQGFFGETVNDSVRERIGDLIIVANDKLILVEQSRQSQQCAMVGHHGGLTDDESQIPLLSYGD